MCLNICSTLEAEFPERRMAKQRRKFAAGILVEIISGWLFQVYSFLGQSWL